MVEAIDDSNQLDGFTVPDPGNLHRTLNLAAPYGRRKPKISPTATKYLLESDQSLGEEKLIEMGWA